MRTDAQAILFVDDEAVSRQWFSRCFGDEFEISTAASVDEALAILTERGESFAALITDYRMPEQDGMKLLRFVRREHRHLVRLLVTAYAEKDVAIAAVNQGQVMRILEKPLEEEPTREALREALSLYRHQALERALNEGRAAALRETLGFLAHELNTPLATVRGSVAAVLERHRPPEPGDAPGTVRFEGLGPQELLAALQRAERRALYCQSLVATFVQSARDAYPGAAPQTVSAASLLGSLVDEYPFEDRERHWVSTELRQDFRLPGRRDLLYLVLCTLTKNAILALRDTAEPRLRIEVDCAPGPGAPRAWIRFIDNGPGIAPEVLARLTREPVTTRAATGGNGMGLMFCQRVMQAAGGAIRLQSALGHGTTVELAFERGVQPAVGAA
ncbi:MULTISPECIES: hybrid sensor histidine kinase/response regulator [unclassified Hydrogenophaga]|uniref:hybrid sensor histidine kinase/response regulator n=3 Tax=Hydrogenophaga TaxID=47420 RepID=UPI000878B152|nr:MULTISPECIES: hybrid sensor histidine kinase/response regulator [unclassified Hydrogenophaga]MBN9372073.1 hybrid sensor histidine kinase/response regulator [Hydrogenophaga sp.]